MSTTQVAAHTLQHLLALRCQLLQLHHLLLPPLQGLIVLVACTLELPFQVLPAAVDTEAVLLGVEGGRLLSGEPCLQVLFLDLQLGQDRGEAGGVHDEGKDCSWFMGCQVLAGWAGAAP